MEKLIFLILAVPILIFVLYLGGSAIMTGFKAKGENAPSKDEEKESIKRQIEDIERLEKELGYSDEGITDDELPEEEQEFIPENIIIRNEEKE